MSTYIDYRDKSMNYKYIIEEFHYEYKLNTKYLIELLDRYIAENKMTTPNPKIIANIVRNYNKEYPEKNIDELVTECQHKVDLVEKYFVGYVNALDLAKCAYKYYALVSKPEVNTDEVNTVKTEFNKLGSMLDVEIVVKNTVKEAEQHFTLAFTPEEQQRIIKHSMYKRFSNHLTVVKNIFIVQSPKDKKTDLPTIHYSLKEKFLSDFRALRKKAKQSMEEAELSGDHLSFVRFNAKQLAIKVLCNSEYGASGNATFAHYDPDIAAAVTHCARSLIGMLTSNLESPFIYVDKKFMDGHKEDIDSLVACNALTIEHDSYTDNELYTQRRHTVRRIFNDVYDVQDHDVFKLVLQPSKVVYQDTDSNYYVNNYIQNYFTHDLTQCNPTILDNMMWTMYHHNMLLSDFTTDAIARRPVGLGFEGSFLVCRYLNRKKKYYGRQWSPDGLWFPKNKIENPKAYMKVDGNDVLIKDYNKYFVPKKTILPYEDGTYINMNYDKLLNSSVNYLDYVKSFGCKCTGVDLARRDQYKFINIYHIYILQQDLQIMKYTGLNNVWHITRKDVPMKNVIDNIVDRFLDMFDNAQQYVKLIKSGVEPNKGFDRYIKFNISTFAKTGAYRPNKPNAPVTQIVNLHEKQDPEKFKSYKPKPNERISYVVRNVTNTKKMFEKSELVSITNDQIYQEVRQAIAANLVENGLYGDTVAEVMDLPDTNEEMYADTTYSQLTPDYEEFYSAFMLNNLDKLYYVTQLVSAIMLYIIADLYPEEVYDLDNDETLTEKERNESVNKLKEEASKQYLVEHGLITVKVTKKTIEKVYDKIKDNTDAMDKVTLLYKIVHQITDNTKITVKNLETFINNELFYWHTLNKIQTMLDERCSYIDTVNNKRKDMDALSEIVKNMEKAADENELFTLPKGLKQKFDKYFIKNVPNISDTDWGHYITEVTPAKCVYDDALLMSPAFITHCKEVIGSYMNEVNYFFNHGKETQLALDYIKTNFNYLLRN